MADLILRDVTTEETALRAVRDFTYYKDESARRDDHDKDPDFQFQDVWEWNCRDYDWWFLWACHGIVWGIAQYDEAKAVVAEPTGVAS